MWMNLNYTPATKWATSCAVSMCTTTTTTITAGIMTKANQKITTMGSLLMLTMHAGMAMRKTLRSYMSSTAQMVSDAFSLKKKFVACHDIPLTKNMKKVVDKQLYIG